MARIAGDGDVSLTERDWPGVAIRLMRMGAGLVLDLADAPEGELGWIYTMLAKRFFEAQRERPQACFFFL